ncbi:DUF4288 domain-containing protein [Hahella sp. NBU794]|uniref:DUF4288 domain-containing protein n=1 Tax=Hahella sp. NBU794 TaxID=3422590 RepID=UPI003D6F6BC3
MSWYAVKSLYHFGIKESGKNIYEERIVCFKAKSFDSAHAKALKEAEKYAKDCNFELHPEQSAYKQDGKKLRNGYEIWSVLYESDLDLEAFYNEHYLKYDYNPDS